MYIIPCILYTIMEFPGTRLNHTIRTTLLVFFIALFFVLTPTIIMYTMGYRYDWRFGLLREIGAISIDVEPASTVVYLDDIKINQSLPVRLKNITPRKYVLRLEAPGYITWEKEIEVKNKETVYIKDISLLKKKSIQKIVSGQTRGLALSADRRFLAFARAAKQNWQVVIWPVADNSTIIPTNIISTIPPQITWDIKANLFVVVTVDELYIVDINKSDAPIKLKTASGTPPVKWQWRNSAAGAELVYQDNNALYAFRPTLNNSTLITPAPFFDWYLEDNNLWTLQQTTSSGNLILVKDTLGFASNFSKLEDLPAGSRNQLKIMAALNNVALVKSTSQNTAWLVNANHSYQVSEENYKISPFGNWWLIWSPWELWTYSNGDQPFLLNRSGEGLKQVLPLDSHNTLALILNDRVSILYPYYFVAHDIISGQIESAVADTNNHIFYGAGTVDGQDGIWKLEY